GDIAGAPGASPARGRAPGSGTRTAGAGRDPTGRSTGDHPDSEQRPPRGHVVRRATPGRVGPRRGADAEGRGGGARRRLPLVRAAPSKPTRL
ncbi:MAG: hypothetical protein AVDCRST_MAG49-1748, partial [uncultured Thermomicrobiales bacterium]